MRADVLIAEIAARQHGLVTRTQLLAAGQHAGVLHRRLRSSQLRRLHQGVYQVGPVAMPLARLMAAVLACSGGRGAAAAGAFVSHHDAGRTWSFWRADRRQPGNQPVHVLVPGLARGRRTGIRAHRVDSLAVDETTRFDGIPITTPARTLLDLAACLPPREVERLVAYADRESLLTLEALAHLLDRRARHRGAVVLRSVLSRPAGPQLTRSEAELRLLELIRQARLPEPQANVRIEGFEVDFLWRSQQLVVEVDGFTYHSSASAFERDRRRDTAITAAGFRVMRVSWRQIQEEAVATAAAVAQALVR
jgi:very-short-patch-repair endonuclease/predicted transcriptional regulator of viral defense system